MLVELRRSLSVIELNDGFDAVELLVVDVLGGSLETLEMTAGGEHFAE